MDSTAISNIDTLSQSTAPVRARMLFERLVTQFPTSVRYWRVYIEQEVNILYSSPPPCSNLCMYINHLHTTANILRRSSLSSVYVCLYQRNVHNDDTFTQDHLLFRHVEMVQRGELALFY